MESVIADEKKNSTDFFNELQGFMDPAYQFRISRNYLHQTKISWLQKYSQMADEHWFTKKFAEFLIRQHELEQKMAFSYILSFLL